MTGRDLLSAPDDSVVDRAVRDFAREVRRAYGSRLKGLYLFGSRARGDHTADSDADVAVVLADGDWRVWDEKMRLADIEYDIIVDSGVEPQGWPVSESEWRNPEMHENPPLMRAMRRDAKRIEVAV